MTRHLCAAQGMVGAASHSRMLLRTLLPGMADPGVLLKSNSMLCVSEQACIQNRSCEQFTKLGHPFNESVISMQQPS